MRSRPVARDHLDEPPHRCEQRDHGGRCKLVKLKDRVHLTSTSFIVRYSKRHAPMTTFGSVSVVVPTADSNTTIGVGPNH